MSEQTNLRYWASNIKHHWTNPDTICAKFWQDLVTEISHVVNALNAEMGKDRLTLTDETVGNFIRVTFDEHELRIHFDRRTGYLEYRYATPSLSKLSEEEPIITGAGNVVVSTDSSFFTATTSPELNLHGVAHYGNTWTIPEQLSELLVQKLVAPNFHDNRFKSAT
jgi:hypothetical protein